MVKVGNQGLDDRYIRLRSHRISHPVVSGLRQSHSITFSRPGFRPGFHVWFRSTKKLWQKTKTQIITNASMFHNVGRPYTTPFGQSFEPELVSRPQPRTSNAPCLAKGNL